ncbi:EamA family transporter [Neisseriaceae bacterium PsAf]|nr:EamA family transporter [Neisseriaceae bacterium PsAf]
MSLYKMILIALSVIFSVAVSIILKLSSKDPDISLRQIIAFNYITAIILCYILLKPTMPKDINSLSWSLFLSLGILLPSIFIVMGYAIKNIGIIKTDIAQRLALFIPILASFTIFNETANPEKIIGISLAFLAILLLFNGKSDISDNKPKKQLVNIIYFLTVFVGFGIIDILFKQVAASGTDFSLTLALTFSLAAIILFSLIFLQKETINRKNIMIGSLLGLFNFTNIYFYLRSHQYYSQNPTLVFTAVNIGVIILGTFFGKILFKEPLNYRNWLGIVMAILSIVFLFNGEKLIHF